MRRHRVAISFVFMAGGALAAFVVWQRSRPVGVGFIVSALVAFGTIALDLFARPAAELRAATEPEPGPAPVDAELDRSAGGPYRGRLRRALDVSLPVSGVALSLVLGGCLLGSALLVPLLLQLSPWIEAQLVLLVWWIVACALMSGMLFRGVRFQDDLDAAGWPWRSGGEAPDAGDRRQAPFVPSPFGCVDELGTLALVGLAIAGAAWLIVELVVPLVFLVVYALTRSALAHVMNDTHRCRGALGRSLWWGGFWATLYVGPLAFLVWAVEMLGRH